MKTKLTGYDLLFIYNALREDLRVSNYPKDYKIQCEGIMMKIANSLEQLNVEIKEKK